MVKKGTKSGEPVFKLDPKAVEESKEKGRILKFTKGMTEFRRAHNSLTSLKFFTKRDNNNNGLKDLTYVGTCGGEIGEHDGHWNNSGANFTGMRIDSTEYGDKETASIFIATNKGGGDIECTLPKNLPGKKWHIVADTAKSDDVNVKGELFEGGKYTSKDRSVMVFIEK